MIAILATLISVGFGGNGSIGIGNAPMIITEQVVATNVRGTLRRLNNAIVDHQSSAVLLEITKIDDVEVLKLISSGRLLRAGLGSIDGYEYTPLPGSKEQNFWVVCDQPRSHCIKLTPKKRIDARIAELIGTLKRQKKNHKPKKQ